MVCVCKVRRGGGGVIVSSQDSFGISEIYAKLWMYSLDSQRLTSTIPVTQYQNGPYRADEPFVGTGGLHLHMVCPLWSQPASGTEVQLACLTTQGHCVSNVHHFYTLISIHNMSNQGNGYNKTHLGVSSPSVFGK